MSHGDYYEQLFNYAGMNISNHLQRFQKWIKYTLLAWMLNYIYVCIDKYRYNKNSIKHILQKRLHMIVKSGKILYILPFRVHKT